MVSCRAPASPKMVIFTPSRSLALAPLKSIDLDASTVKILCVPSPFENVRCLDCRSTSTGADGGAFLRSMCRVYPRFRYNPTVSPANTKATAALQCAYLAASLFRIRVAPPFQWHRFQLIRIAHTCHCVKRPKARAPEDSKRVPHTAMFRVGLLAVFSYMLEHFGKGGVDCFC